MMHDPFTIGLIQMKMATGDLDANLGHATDLLGQAAKKGVQIACLPELFMSEYFCQTHDTAIFDLAETIPGPTTEALSAVARKHNMVVIGSLFEKRGQGIYHNTAVIIDADGSLLGVYRKMHIPHDPLFYEKYYFTPGDTGFKAFDTAYARVGTLVCWDQWFPEGARLTALQGAQVLFYPTAIGWQPPEKAEYGSAQLDAWQTAPARPRHRQRHLCRRGQPHRFRAGGRQPRHRILGPQLHRRPVRPQAAGSR